jgi:hypothetical protein
MLGRPAMGRNSTVLRSGRQGPPLPDTDLPQAAGSNFSSNIPLEPSGTGYVENLVRLQVQAEADDLLHDLGGAAKVPQGPRLLLTRFRGILLPLSSHLTVNLDLHVRDSAGVTVASSASWNNGYEIAEFGARGGETYEIRIRRWSGTDDIWFGVAWTVTGFDLVLKRLAESSLAALGPR